MTLDMYRFLLLPRGVSQLPSFVVISTIFAEAALRCAIQCSQCGSALCALLL